jgi:hypothetical protein
MPNAIRYFIRLALVFGCALVACSNPAQSSVVVEWTTATEINTAGFNLYRSDSTDGPYAKVNTDLIPASSDPVRGSQYRYEDRDVLLGKTYYYKLEDVELTGATVQHGPIQVTATSTDGTGVVVLMVGVSGFLVLSGVALAVRNRRRIKHIQAVEKSE